MIKSFLFKSNCLNNNMIVFKVLVLVVIVLTFSFCYDCDICFQHVKDGQFIQTKLRCAAGLADLATKKYKSAAKYFLQASFDHCDFPEVGS